MRIVLIIQSLIIFAGAYYIYTLTRPAVAPALSETEEVSTVLIETKVESEVELPVEDEQELNVESATIIEEHNDLGMEFPVPDEEVLEN